MASLQKTYSGDLTTAIAGKLYEAIKDADEKNQLEKTNASQDVKQAAVKAKKEEQRKAFIDKVLARQAKIDAVKRPTTIEKRPTIIEEMLEEDWDDYGV